MVRMRFGRLLFLALIALSAVAGLAGAAPTGCPTPQYAYDTWLENGEDRDFEGQWVMQWVHYKRTRTNLCDGSETTEHKTDGPFRLWQAVPDQRIADVNRPQGDTQGVPGSPLWSSELSNGPQAEVGPSANPPQTTTPPDTASTPAPPTPFHVTSLSLLVGLLVHMAVSRRYRKQWEPAEYPAGDPPVLQCLAPEYAPADEAGAYIEEFFGLFPGSALRKLSPGEAVFMADYLARAQDSGNPVAYARAQADEFARFHVLVARLQELHGDPWCMQQEIALATGRVYPVWELLGVSAGKLDRSPSPLDMPPNAVFPSHADLSDASFLVSISPVGDYYDGVNALTGRDLISGESLKAWERILAGVGAAVPFVSGKALGEALGMIRKGGDAAQAGRATLMDLVRKALPDLTDEGAANLARFMEWADRRMLTRGLAQATEELAQVGAGPMVARWMSELEPDEAVRMIEHYRYNKHLLGALNEARMGQQIKRLVEEQKAVLLHFNEAVNQGGADLIWIDRTNNRVVFVDVKASVSGNTISQIETFQKRMAPNLELALELIEQSITLTRQEKAALLAALDRGEFDLQIVLAGNAKVSHGLTEKMLDELRTQFHGIRIRGTRHLD